MPRLVMGSGGGAITGPAGREVPPNEKLTEGVGTTGDGALPPCGAWPGRPLNENECSTSGAATTGALV